MVLWAFAAEPDRGAVCVAPNSEKPPTRISPGGMYNPATLSVKIDNRKPVPWPHKESLKIDRLDLTKRHLVVLTSAGRRTESFWFRFSPSDNGALCMTFDGYQGVQLAGMKGSPWCTCQ